MVFSLTAEQEELRTSVRQFLERKSSSERVRKLMAPSSSTDTAVWSQMAQQLGLQGLAIPEEYGGAGFGPVELGIVLREMGRVLLVAPYFSTVALAAQTLVACDDETAKQKWLPGIAAGSLTATLAAEETGGWDLDAVHTVATASDGGWVLHGVKKFVVDGDTADLLLVVARDQDGQLGLFAVESGATGMSRSRQDVLDLTRPITQINLSATPAVRIESSADATTVLEHARDLVLAAVAAEQVGGAERCLEMAVDYAKNRVQFGHPIGSFQAIKHKCANILVEVESGRSAASYCSSVVESGGVEASIAAALAKTHCSNAFTLAAKENIQIHGGIGYTWEHDAHLYLRRAKSSELLFGTSALHRERLARLMEL